MFVSLLSCSKPHLSVKYSTPAPILPDHYEIRIEIVLPLSPGANMARIVINTAMTSAGICKIQARAGGAGPPLGNELRISILFC